MPKLMNLLDPSEHIASDYLNSVFTDLVGVVNKTVKRLNDVQDRFEGIVVRGTSGLLVGPQVAALMHKPWCVVRKPGENTHSDFKTLEGWFGFKTYIVIDDLIATGATLKAIQTAVHDSYGSAKYKWTRGQPECVGYYTYNYDELVWRGDGNNFSYHDKYFIFPEVADIPKQIAQAIGRGPAFAADNS